MLEGLFRRDPAKRASGALQDFYRVPAQGPETASSELNLLAVDVETTGLKASRHRMVSIGWVPVTAGVIELSGAGYVVLRGHEGFSVGSSAVIHQLTDDEIAAGVSHREALEQLLAALQGRVMLAHFATMEQEFLSHACQEHFGAPLRVPTVDTFVLERRHMERMATYPRGEDLRLARVRERYGLPRYANHNALGDALACAELFLAQLAQLPPGRVDKLRSLRD